MFVSKKRFKQMEASRDEFKSIAETAMERLQKYMELYEKALEDLYTQKRIQANLKKNHAKAIFGELDRPLDKLITEELSAEEFVKEYMQICEQYLGDENDI